MIKLNYDLFEISKEIINLYALVEELTLENMELKEYKIKYYELLTSSIEHNNKLSGNMLNLLLSNNCTLHADNKNSNSE